MEETYDIVKSPEDQQETRNNLIEEKWGTLDRYTKDDGNRLKFHRERDRIVWSRSFKRLAGKTQVYLRKFGDHHRTRLTHSLEVMQLSTSLARSLGLNDALCEAIALSHDLGHTPFGHAGEEAIDIALQTIEFQPNLPFLKSFNHYENGLDIVSYVDSQSSGEESESPSNKKEIKTGLNLSTDVREGILKHTWDLDPNSRKTSKSLGSLKFQSKYREFSEGKSENGDYKYTDYGNFESRVVRMCDKISYLISDLEDGLRIGAIHWDDFKSIDKKSLLNSERILKEKEKDNLKCMETDKGYSSVFEILKLKTPNAGENEIDAFLRSRSKIVKRIMTQLEKRWTENLKGYGDENIKHSNLLVYPPVEVYVDLSIAYDRLQKGKLYSHSVIKRCNERAKAIVNCLFCLYLKHPELIPWQYRKDYHEKKESSIGYEVKKLYQLNKPKIHEVEVKLGNWHDFLRSNSFTKCPVNNNENKFKRNVVDIIAAKDYVAGMTDDFAEKCFDSINIYCGGAYEIAKSSNIMLPESLLIE